VQSKASFCYLQQSAAGVGEYVTEVAWRFMFGAMMDLLLIPDNEKLIN
jgi:hypothetical protein